MERGSEFVSHFFHSLSKALDIRLHFTSRHHLEDDGQTKWINQTLDQYPWIYSNYQQDNWSECLPLAEFSYNKTLSATTSVSPYIHTLLIKITTPTSQSIQNKIFPPLEHESTPLTSTPSTNSSVRRWPMPKNTIKDPRMLNDFWHWTSKSVRSDLHQS